MKIDVATVRKSSEKTIVENASPASVRRMSTSKFSDVSEKNKTYGGPVKSTKSYGGDSNLVQQSSSKSAPQKTTKDGFENFGRFNSVR